MKKFATLILIVSMLFMLTGCFGSGKSKTEINLYFKNSQTNELTVEKIKYDASQNTVDMANYAMQMLMKGPMEESNVATIPPKTTFSSVTVKNETATVDFSGNFSLLTGLEELLARFSVFRTLCDIPGISAVTITVEGQPLISSATGKEVGVLNKKDIVIDITGSDNKINSPAVEKTVVKLNFATTDFTGLKVEERKVETQDTISIEKTIINELIKGPSSPELTSVIPEGTKLLNIETRDRVCYVNLSQDFISKFTGNNGKLTVYSIVNSLCSLESVSSVQILIEGEKGAALGGYLFDEPLTPDLNIVKQSNK